MSYHVLARKYRPRCFQELVGQEVVARALTHALEQNRLHHAYLFTGTRGVGKTTIARILSRCLNCEEGISANPCGVCGTCREIDEGRFVDLIEVDAASRTKVEDTRELLDNVQYAPTRGRYKVYLIDEVHMLSGHSFNALLKTLEEPPPHVKFLLATTDPQKLPITILSRCLQFALKPMTPERVVGHLQHVLAAEQIRFDDAALWLLARGAQGSMRDALSLTDQAIAFGRGELIEADVRTLLGSIDRDLVFRVLDALLSQDAASVLSVVAGMAEQSIDFAGAITELISVLHRLAVAQAVPEAIDNSEGDRDRLLAIAAALTAEDLQLYYQMALHGRRDLPLAVDARSGFEMTLLRMLSFRPDTSAPVSSGGARPARVAAAASAAAPAVATAIALAAAAPAPAPAVLPIATLPSSLPATPEPLMEQAQDTPSEESLAPIIAEPAEHPQSRLMAGDWSAEAWAQWVERSGLTGAPLNLARHTYLHQQADTAWELRLSPQHQMLAGGQAFPPLQLALARDFPTQAIHLALAEPEVETPVQRRQRLAAARREAAETALRNDPVVKALESTFAARLLPESLTLTH
ncbi:MAG: DNA polymerase III subunit gamma/tau [Paraperlucidibaca sp.]